MCRIETRMGNGKQDHASGNEKGVVDVSNSDAQSSGGAEGTHSVDHWVFWKDITMCQRPSDNRTTGLAAVIHLKTHEKSVHEMIRDKKCPHCSKSFATKHNLFLVGKSFVDVQKSTLFVCYSSP